ncbi:MAG: hypothetical protein JOZ89_10490, partial [Gammaproteobacteria bacterium]|nr:hypothetical protein [Gammaproteobacteria bacterium]
MRLQFADGRDAAVRGACTWIALAVMAAPTLAGAAAQAGSPPSASAPAAMSLDPSLFKALQWRCIGPYRG